MVYELRKTKPYATFNEGLEQPMTNSITLQDFIETLFGGYVYFHKIEEVENKEYPHYGLVLREDRALNENEKQALKLLGYEVLGEL
ncbi:MAG: hypothetical protein HZB67_01190 [Candidatus Aenigmarchaeota archaeon]|nr:hypothetical protein [Candidatus Aenigmarchaeota archaeon]